MYYNRRAFSTLTPPGLSSTMAGFDSNTPVEEELHGRQLLNLLE